MIKTDNGYNLTIHRLALNIDNNLIANLNINKENQLKSFILKCFNHIHIDTDNEVRIAMEVKNPLPFVRKSCIKMGERYYRTVIADLLLENNTVIELKCVNVINSKILNDLEHQMNEYLKCISIKKCYGLLFEISNKIFVIYRLDKYKKIKQYYLIQQ